MIMSPDVLNANRLDNRLGHGAGENVYEGQSTEFGINDSSEKDVLRGRLFGGTQSVFAASLNMFTVVLGAAIVTVPQHSRQVGVLTSIAICMLSIAIVLWTGFLMTDTFAAWNKRQSTPMCKFEDLGLWSFGRRGYLFIQVSVIIFLAGLGATYMLLEVKQVMSLIASVWPAAAHWEYRVVLIAISPLFVLVCFFEDYTALGKITPYAAFAAFSCVVCIMAQALQAYPVTSDWSQGPGPGHEEVRSLMPELAADTPRKLGMAMASFFGNFGLHCIFPSMMSEMEQPVKFKRVLVIVMLGIFALYSMLIMTTWMAFGNFIQDEVLVNMRQVPANSNEVFLDPAAWSGEQYNFFLIAFNICMAFNIFVSFPLATMSIFKTLRTILPPKLMQPNSRSNYMMRTAVLAGEVCIAMTSPSVGALFGFFASLTLPLHTMYVPILCGAAINSKLGLKPKPWYHQFINGIILVIGLLVWFFGVWQGAKEVANTFR